MSHEVGGLSDSACDGTLTLGGDRPREDVVAHGDEGSGKGGTPWGVLVRSTNVGDPKIDEGKCPLLGGTRRHGHFWEPAAWRLVHGGRGRMSPLPWGVTS